MTTKSPIAGTILALAAWTAGCTKLTEERGTDSTTHWLERCSEHTECGALRCLCGVCSLGCQDDEGCRRFGSLASCETGAAACSGSGGMCVAQCVRAADCQEPRGAACVEGRCVQEASAAPAATGDGAWTERGPEAGMGVDAATGADAGSGADATTGEPSVTMAADADGGELDASALCAWQLMLKGGGRRMVPCTSECTFSLTLNNASSESCGSLAAMLFVVDAASRAWTVEATLSEQAMARAAQLARALEASPPSAVSCPDCFERDSAWLTLPGSDQFTIDVSYPLGDPPAGGHDADGFVQSLIDQLRACEGPLIRECKASEPSEPEPQPSDECRISYANADNTRAVSCSISEGAEAPCRTAAACLCEGGFFSNPATPECVDWWLIPRGAITFADLCARDEASATRSLGQAVREFAVLYSLQATATPRCEDLRAFY